MFKTCALFSLCACVGLASDFVTGQAARLVIGQGTFTAQQPGATDKLLGGVGGLAYANGTLFVADSNRTGLTPINNRVLLFPTQSFPKPLDPIQAYIARCAVCVGQASVVLGQTDFTSVDFHISQTGLRLPTAVATDGKILAVADTANNRVMIWNSIPNSNGQPADIELGQPDFKTILQGSQVVVDNKSFRGPQGVWIQNGKLFVADTQNHRVLIWNTIPTQNRQPADVVLGQANFNVAVQPDLTKATNDPHANSLLNPVSVSSDGTRLYVADLGNNRVLIWNSIPTTNQKPADVVVGQKDFDTGIANDGKDLCPSNGTASDGTTLTYPARCGKTMDFPRFALSDGTRLFIADGGNDRVLIYNAIPTQNAAAPDVILGQSDENSSAVSSATDLFHPLLRQSAADLTPTPTGLAWDGTNLYVTDPANRRVLVFTPGEPLVPNNGVRNAASREIFALGSLTLGGTITVGDIVKATINGVEHDYTMVKDDTLVTAMTGLAASINSGTGDAAVFAQFEPILSVIKLVARKPGTDGNSITLAVSGSDNATFTITASGSTLQGGENAAIIAPGTLITLLGHDLADTAASADLSQDHLPLDLGGVQLYCDGNRSPLLYVSPTQINGQMPFEFLDSNNISCYVRIQHADGRVVATSAVAVPLDQSNPGIFASEGSEPRAAIAFHTSSFATGTITVDGGIEAGDIGTITVGDRSYKYTVQAGDTLTSVRDALVALINANTEEEVVAVPEPAFHRIQLRAKVPGPAGNGITFGATTDKGDNDNLFLILTNLSTTLCCANRAGTPVTQANPAVPGETILFYGTGLGTVGPDEARLAVDTGSKYKGTAQNDPALHDPQQFVSSLAGGSTANVISANLAPGMVGVYEVRLSLGLGTPASPLTQLTISQNIYTSNIVTIPVVTPDVQTPPGSTGTTTPPSDPTGDPAPPPPTTATPITVQSSASFAFAPVAPGMIAFIEAPGVAPALVTAPSGPWPATLSGVSIQITDSQGQKLAAPIYFVAPSSTGFLIPANAALGQATIKATTSSGAVLSGTLQIDRLSPGLYTAHSSGSGVAAGLFVRVATDQTQTIDFLFNPATHDPVPVDLGLPGEQVFLSLYGTGFRSAGSAMATVGGVSVPVSAFLPVTQYQGLDMVNIGPLPRSLAGRGAVDVVVSFDGKPTNTVSATIH
jgi:uncharacterized protein (TIGR03437 family)